MLKNLFKKWLGIPIGLNSTFWADFKKTNNEINEDKALAISTVWACTSLISETVSTLPIHFYKKNPNGTRERINNYFLSDIVRKKPNSESDAMAFWNANLVSILLHGNGINKIQRVNNKIVGLRFIHFDNLYAKVERNKIELYELINGKKERIYEKDIFKITGFSLDGIWGIGVIQKGAGTFENALSALKAANENFEKGLFPTVAFTVDRVLTKDQREMFKNGLSNITGALNAGKSPLLEAGMDAKVLSINPRDAQLLESRQYSVEDICRWFKIDPSLVGKTGAVSNWGTGIEQKMINFLVFTLRPWITRIEQAINNNLIPIEDRDTYYAEFSIEGLLRADSKSRMEYYKGMGSIYTVDEVRSLENLPPIGGNAGKILVNNAMRPIEELGVENENKEP